MDERLTAGTASAPRAAAIPWPFWLLVAGAAVQLGVQVAPDSYSVFGPYFLVSGEMVLNWVRSTAPFLLAAAVVLGVGRWPEGRRLLLVGAAFLAGGAVPQMAQDVFWAIWETNPGVIDDGAQPWLVAASLGATLAFVTAHAVLAAGLWQARTPGGAGRRGAIVIGVIAAAGLLATGAGVAAIAPSFGRAGPVDDTWVSVAGAVLMAIGFGALAAVAIAAVRSARRAVPESLIAIGATMTMLGTAWMWSAPAFMPTVAWSEETLLWMITLPNTVATLGLIAMVVGFGLGLVMRRVRSEPAAGAPAV